MGVEHDDMVFFLQNIARQLALIPTAVLEQHVRESGASLRRADSLGAMLNPTAYRNALYSGEIQDARNQLEIVRHLLAARRAIDVREAFVTQKAIERAERGEG